MRLLLATVLLVAAPSSIAQSKPADILTAETQFWTNYAAGDTAALSKQFTPDFNNIEQEIWTAPQVLDFVKTFHAQCSLAPVKILDPKITFLTPTIATIVYHAQESPTCGGKSITGETNISTVWILTNGQWQMHLHTEYAVAPQ